VASKLGGLVGKVVKRTVKGVAGPPPPDLSFLNDPNNPYYTDPNSPFYIPQGGGGGYEDGGVVYVDGGGYDGGGGGGYPALPPYDPARDPAFQALLAQLNLNEGQARAAAEAQKAMISRQAANAVPRIQEAGIEQRRGINFNAEDRGMFRSGQRLRDLSLQQRSEQQRLADVYTNLADRNTNIDLSTQAKLNDIANQRVQAGFEAKLRAAT
jgi:hypothetical protein